MSSSRDDLARAWLDAWAAPGAAGPGWQDMLRAALQQPPSFQDAPSHPLPVFLLFLDLLGMLKALRDPRSTTATSTDRPPSRQDELLDRHELCEHFIAYIYEMYLLCPPAPGDTGAEAPFRISQTIVPALADVAKTQAGPFSEEGPRPDDGLEHTLHKAAVEAFYWLCQWQDEDGTTLVQLAKTIEPASKPSTDGAAKQPEQQSNDQVTASDLGDILERAVSLGPNADTSLQNLVAQSLLDKRTSITPMLPQRPSLYPGNGRSFYSVGLLRWLLASLLRNYLGRAYGQKYLANGQIRYSENETDDDAVRCYFSRPKRFSLSDSVLTLSAPLSPTEDPAARAERDATKRDDKLRWLFGEPVNSRLVNRNPNSAMAFGSKGVYPPFLAPITPVKPLSPTGLPDDETQKETLSPSEVQAGVQFYPRASTSSLQQSTAPRRAYSAAGWYASSQGSGSFNTSFGQSSPSPSKREFGNVGHSPYTFLSQSQQRTRGLTNGSSVDEVATIDTGSAPSSPRFPNLLRISSISTTDSQTHLMRSSRRRRNSVGVLAASTSTGRRSPLPTVADGPENQISPQPFKNFTDVQQSVGAVRPRASSLDSASFVSDNLPPTINLLSAEDKQNFVRQNRKLQSVLGANPDLAKPLKKTVRRHLQKSRQIPADEYGEEVDRSFSTATSSVPDPSHIGDNTDGPVPLSIIPASETPKLVQSDHADTPTRMPWSPSTDSLVSPATEFRRQSISSDARAKEARRRKLIKVQAFLGERVPASALLSEVGPPPPPPPQTRPKRRAAGNILAKAGSKIGSKLSGSRPGSDRDGGRSRHSTYESSAGEETSGFTEWDYVTPDYNALADTSTKVDTEGDGEGRDTTINGSAAPAIAVIRRARKLEKVFGSLPPQQLYHSQQRKKLAPRDERMCSLYRTSSIASRDSVSSLYRARASIASLRYIAESGDATLLDELARVVLEDDSTGEDSDDSDHEEFAEAVESQLMAHKMSEGLSAHGSVSGNEDDEPQASARAHKDLKGKERVHSQKAEKPASVRASHDTDSSGLPQSFEGQMSILGSANSHTRLHHIVARHRQPGAGGRDSVMSAATAVSNADSAIDVRSQRSMSRASSRSSIDSVRLQFRRAHKLAHMFGTTRGEVFNRVLDDIVADIQELDEDEDLSEHEKQEVLDGVAALRAQI